METFRKGSNTITSYLYHYLTTKLVITPKKIKIYCDNCRGQNKNKTIVHFLYWVVHTKKWFKEVELNFMIPGHTKFSVDRHFGYGKKNIKKIDIETIS